MKKPKHQSKLRVVEDPAEANWKCKNCGVFVQFNAPENNLAALPPNLGECPACKQSASLIRHDPLHPDDNGPKREHAGIWPGTMPIYKFIKSASNTPKKIWNDFSFINIPFVTVDGSTITFQIQDGPIKEVGVNGTQIDTLIEVASNIISSFNARFPCEENDAAIQYLGFALDSLAQRKKNREQRGVEGYDKK